MFADKENEIKTSLNKIYKNGLKVSKCHKYYAVGIIQIQQRKSHPNLRLFTKRDSVILISLLRHFFKEGKQSEPG